MSAALELENPTRPQHLKDADVPVFSICTAIPHNNRLRWFTGMLLTSELWLLRMCVLNHAWLGTALETLRLGDAASVKGYKNFT